MMRMSPQEAAWQLALGVLADDGAAPPDKRVVCWARVRTGIEKQDTDEKTRRDFVKTAAYEAPAIFTLPAAPEYAKAGSVKPTDGRSSTKGRPPGKSRPAKQ